VAAAFGKYSLSSPSPLTHTRRCRVVVEVEGLIDPPPLATTGGMSDLYQGAERV